MARERLAVQFAALEARHVTGVVVVDEDPKAYTSENK